MENSFELWHTMLMAEKRMVGLIIRRHRKKANLTQQELAAEIGMTGRAVSNWETGKFLPNRDSLMRLADYFEIGLDDFGLTEEESAQINAIVDTTPSIDLADILNDIRDAGERRPDIARSLLDWWRGWRAGDGDGQSH